jgi:hypothetical protein
MKSKLMHLIELITGVSAVRSAPFTMGLQASRLEAPKARYISTLSRFSLGQGINDRQKDFAAKCN